MAKTVRKRPNPAVAQTERSAQLSEDMANLALQSFPKASALGTMIANQKRTTANKIKQQSPNLIETEDTSDAK